MPLVIKALKVNGLVLLLLMGGTLVAAPVVLRLFGPQYATHATPVLVLLVVAAPFIALIQAVTVILNLQGRMGSLTLLSIVEAGLVVAMVAVFADRGITGVGIGWLTGYGLTALAYVVGLSIDRRRHLAEDEAPKFNPRQVRER
jgi:O-antigen/teichoic acid export membrane protein